MSRRAALAALLAWPAVAAGACSGDHDALKKKPTGAGGSAGDAALEADAVEADALLDAVVDQFVEPPGASVLTLLHGVVDASHIAFCFAKVDAGIAAAPQGSPIPAEGLPWGRALSLSSVPAFDWNADDLQPIVIAAANFASLSGQTCAELVALAESHADAGSDASIGDASDAAGGDATDASSDVADASGDAGGPEAGDGATELPPPPPLRALELPVLPAGTLGGGYSNLLVATGCIGGPAFADDLEKYVCGSNYAPGSPTLAATLVQLSRVSAPTALGLQVVNAVLASESVSVVSVPPESSSLPPLVLASSIAYGAVVPRPPLLSYSKLAFGFPITAATLQVTLSGASTPQFTAPWSAAIAAGKIPEVLDGQTYAIVLLGPSPNVSGAKWWNGPAFTVLSTAPGP